MPTELPGFKSERYATYATYLNIHSRLNKNKKDDITTELSLGMGIPSINEGLVVIGLELVPFCYDDDSMRTITSLLWTLGEDKLIPWRIMGVQHTLSAQG